MSTANLGFELTPEVFWSTLPRWLPGQIERIDGAVHIIKLLVAIHYPDGTPVETISSPHAIVKIRVGDSVEFAHGPANKKMRKAKQQPALLSGVTVKLASTDRIKELQKEFTESIYSIIQKIAKMPLGPSLSSAALEERVAAELQKALASKENAFKSHEEKLLRRIAELERQLSPMQNLQGSLELAQAQLSEYKAQHEQWQKTPERLRDILANIRPIIDNQPLKNEAGREPLKLGAQLLVRLEKALLSRNYWTDSQVLRQYTIAAACACVYGDLILLAGPTGVGKTGLVEQFAEAVGAGRTTIPVRPAWTDPSDLLGFYNPIQRLYQPAPFLESLLDAQYYQSNNRLFFVCLDEMNLARIENYAADLLSRLEKRANGDGKIGLYPREIDFSLREEQRLLATQAEHWTPVDAQRFAVLESHLQRLKPELSLPNNLVVCGTLNVDETVPMPSPKTLDRSYVLQVLPNSLHKTGEYFASPPPIVAKSKLLLEWSRLSELADKPVEARVEHDINQHWGIIADWNSRFFHPLGIVLGYRFSQAYRRFMRMGGHLFNTSMAQLATDFVNMRILPRMSFLKEDTPVGNVTGTNKEGIWKGWINDAAIAQFPGLKDTLEQMQEINRSRVIVQYWM